MLHCRIALLRRCSGLSQLQLAQQLHISPSTIGMYEQGRRIPDVVTLAQMSRIFNVSLDYLITGSEFVPSSENENLNIPPYRHPQCNRCYEKILDIIRENMSPNDCTQT